MTQLSTYLDLRTRLLSFCKVKSESHSVGSDSLRPHGLYSLWNSPGRNTGVGSLSLLWGPNPGLPHRRWILYQLSHREALCFTKPSTMSSINFGSKVSNYSVPYYSCFLLCFSSSLNKITIKPVNCFSCCLIIFISEFQQGKWYRVLRYGGHRSCRLPQDLEHLGQKTRWASFSQAQRRSLTAVSPFRPSVGLMTVPHTVPRGPPTRVDIN